MAVTRQSAAQQCPAARSLCCCWAHLLHPLRQLLRCCCSSGSGRDTQRTGLLPQQQALVLLPLLAPWAVSLHCRLQPTSSANALHLCCRCWACRPGLPLLLLLLLQLQAVLAWQQQLPQGQGQGLQRLVRLARPLVLCLCLCLGLLRVQLVVCLHFLAFLTCWLCARHLSRHSWQRSQGLPQLVLASLPASPQQQDPPTV